jgi:hypothetical protein|tara:strand:- start:275 stop:616 length:342 start_codon:yes stop_codon:yes gene_type:complete
MSDNIGNDLTPIILDLDELKSGKLDEFNVIGQMGAAIKLIMRQMFGGAAMPVTVKGSRSDVKSFAKTIGREKRYMDAYNRHGLNDPRTYKSKFKLNKSVRDFERKTKLKWPFK